MRELRTPPRSRIVLDLSFIRSIESSTSASTPRLLCLRSGSLSVHAADAARHLNALGTWALSWYDRARLWRDLHRLQPVPTLKCLAARGGAQDLASWRLVRTYIWVVGRGTGWGDGGFETSDHWLPTCSSGPPPPWLKIQLIFQRNY